MKLEPMDEFFTRRIAEYDSHMLEQVEGCAEGYRKLATLLAPNTQTLLDLGCGTGLELGPVFERFPDIAVTCIDLTPAMLEKLRQKYGGKNITLVCADYFQVDFGREQFDMAVSFQTMHHFTHAQKQSLYPKIARAVKNGYIEADYMAPNQQTEDMLYRENAALRKEMGVPEDAFYHFDTPCTPENQIRFFKTAGFHAIKKEWQQENLVILSAYKKSR